MKEERKEIRTRSKKQRYVRSKTDICMSLEYGVLTKEQNAYRDSSCGMGIWGEQSIDYLEISVRYKPFSVNILKYQSLRKSRIWRFFASVEMKHVAPERC